LRKQNIRNIATNVTRLVVWVRLQWGLQAHCFISRSGGNNFPKTFCLGIYIIHTNSIRINMYIITFLPPQLLRFKSRNVGLFPQSGKKSLRNCYALNQGISVFFRRAEKSRSAIATL